MPRHALSRAEIAAFRKRTLVAATRVFARDGYKAVTMRAIAEELGTSAMAPYRYFHNKAEIFAMVRAEGYRRFADAQERAFGASSDPLTRLFEMRSAYVHFALEHSDEYRVMFELQQEPEERHPELANQSHRAFALLEEAARQAIAANVLAGEPTTVAHLLWSSLHGMVSLHLAGKLTLGRSLQELLLAPPLRLLVALD